MDDDDVHDTNITTSTSPAPATTTIPTGTTTCTTKPGEIAPHKPPRPVTDAQKNAMILKEAFPTVDDSVIKAVLRASSGQVEPAFNALLGEHHTLKTKRRKESFASDTSD